MIKVAAALLLVVLTAGPALAFDAVRTFRQGATILSGEGGGGTQSNIEDHSRQSDLDVWYLGVRYALVPFKPAGPGILHGSLEVGLEPIYQRYTGGAEGFWAGLSAHGRWHFLGLSFGRFVPYAELGAGAGGTDLRAIEIDSSFAFLLSGGVGLSFFVTDQAAIYGGYRMIHVSNGNTSSELNRGFEAGTGVLGLSYFFK